jgi:hypothetical protein
MGMVGRLGSTGSVYPKAYTCPRQHRNLKEVGLMSKASKKSVLRERK